MDVNAQFTGESELSATIQELSKVHTHIYICNYNYNHNHRLAFFEFIFKNMDYRC